MSGFLAIPREVFDLWFADDGLQGAVYVYLAMKANWQDAKGILPHQRVPLKTGELVTSIRGLATHFGVTTKRIRTVLDNLSKDDPARILTAFIRQEKGTHGTLITVLDYKEIFQGLQRDGHTKGTPGAHSRPHHNKGTREQGNKEDIFVESALADPTHYAQFLNIWNQNRGKLAGVEKITTTRKRKMRARLTEEPNLDYWARLVQRMATSSFCCQGGWATFDWLVGNDTNHRKVGEGKYDNREANAAAFEERLRLRDLELERMGINDWK